MWQRKIAPTPAHDLLSVTDVAKAIRLDTYIVRRAIYALRDQAAIPVVQDRVGGSIRNRVYGRDLPKIRTHVLSTCKKRAWRDDERLAALDAYDNGASFDEIGKALHRSGGAVKAMIELNGGLARRKRVGMRAAQVSRLLGINPGNKTVLRWIERYGLKAKNVCLVDGFNFWHIDWMDLMEWLEDENHFMAYDPERVTEPALREHLIEIRADHPGWWTVGQVAEYWQCSTILVNSWFQRGKLPSVKYGNHYVRADIARAFVPSWKREQ
jgi:hypothetical protein